VSKLTRIYTRTGDDGTTGLVGGQRVPKNSGRIECFGAVDECSTLIGLARRALREHASEPRAQSLDAWLAWTQDSLFNLGSDLATLSADRRADAPTVADADAVALERAIDTAGAFLHQARTVCRRAERLIVALSQTEAVSPAALRYINRLSDALFVWARWINAELGEPEHIWNPNSAPPN
jgi:cob(I)alamin adenosyltransferase